jgi:oxygen-independent coproporphyrinogen-3 oxidase
MEEVLLPIPFLGGIYIHVPFCDQLCSFCPFNKRLSHEREMQDYVAALLTEIKHYAQQTRDSSIDFIYFGGGTPSALSIAQLDQILTAINAHFRLATEVEITLESHPSHLVPEKLKALKSLGINRISSGIQSFNDTLLRRNGAQHSAQQAFEAIRNTRKIIGGISIDLLYRCVGQSLSDLEKDLDHALAEGVEHISAYSLVLPKEEEQPDLMVEAQMTALVHDKLLAKGFEHYASCASGGFDFALKGKRSKYELLHWQAPQHSFIGLGPGAFGFTGLQNTVNCLTLEEYKRKTATEGFAHVSITTISEEELMHRYFALGVKTLKVPFSPFRERFAFEPEAVFKEQIKWLQKEGFAFVQNDSLLLTSVGKLFVDEINHCFNSPRQRVIPHPEEPEIRKLEKHLRSITSQLSL